MRTLGPSQERWQVPLALTFRTEFFRNLLGKKDALLSDCQFESELVRRSYGQPRTHLINGSMSEWRFCNNWFRRFSVEPGRLDTKWTLWTELSILTGRPNV